MEQHNPDSIDFKPFFDMVVGILFILLILIAAQLFFARFETNSPEAQAQQKRAMRLAEQELFLNAVAANLSRAGFSAQADRSANTVSVPLELITKFEKSNTLPDDDAASRYASTLTNAIVCASSTAVASCNRNYDVSLAQVSFLAAITDVAAGATPPPSAQILAMRLEASLFGAAPQFLLQNGSLGTAMFARSFEIVPTAVPAAATGNIQSSSGLLLVKFAFGP